ncbi:MAG: fimbrillin family protein [Bacteroidales bacterium]|nr:fimbrillin family protein [Bacteroidales bacterium]
MKKYLFAALGAGLLMTSCQSDEPFAPGNGTAQQVAFTVSLPDAVSTRAGGINSAAGGVSNNVGANVTFNVALYLIGGSETEPVYTASDVVSSTGNHTSATFEPTLVIGEQYRVVAYAKFDDDTLNEELTAINVTPEINNEQKDEYFANTIVTAAPELSATLKRPFGKLRLIAEDLHEAERQYGAEIANVEVTYQYTRPTVFNAYAELSATDNVYGVFGAYTEAAQTFTAAYGEYQTDTNDSRTIFVDYLPVDLGEQMVPFTVKVTFSNGREYTRDFRQDIPVKRNHLTTLKGRLFTIDSDLTLTIEENFDGETVENFDEDIEWIFANGGTITLQEDVKLKKSLIVAEDANVVLNLNGHNIVTEVSSNDLEIGDAIIVYGNLTIEGEGTVQGNTRAVWARGNYGAKVRINGGHYIGSTTADAKCEVIYASGDGVIDIYDGEFEAVNQAEGFAAPQYAVLNLQGNGKTGCDINVYGGKFKDFNPSDNISENPKKNFVEEGYTSVEADGWYLVGPEVSSLSAFEEAINKVSFVNLNEAIDNGSNLFAINGNDVVINMNDYMITAGGQGTNNYAFNVIGSDVEVNDVNLNGAGFAVLDGSNVTVNRGTIAAKPGKSGRNMFYVVGNSTVTVNEGTYTFDRTSCYFVYVEAGSTCYINGGHFEKLLANNASKDSFVNNASAGTVIITGGTFNVDPTKWLADGYKAEKSGKIWTVSKK